jgi:hypothetical protein
LIRTFRWLWLGQLISNLGTQCSLYGLGLWSFALQEALLVLAELLRRFELGPWAGPEPDLVGRLTLRSRNGVWLQLRRLPAELSF